ncbi:MAG: hypothetical protein IJK98_01640 [Clostridia bacterium]|nr:hypothetical protein [Clostridia bacterium]
MKSRVRRCVGLISFVLAVLLAFGGTAAFGAFGTAASGGAATAYTARNASSLSQEFLDYLAKNVRDCVATVDVSAYDVPVTQTLTDEIENYLYYGCCDLFHLKGAPVYFQNSGKLHHITFTYTCDAAAYRAAMQKIDAVALTLLEGLNDPRLTGAQKALLLHDRLALHCEYGTRYSSKQATDNCRNLYGALVERIAYCEGYTRAYIYLLDKVGIRSEFIASRALGHSWNVVYLDGKPYFVDVTMDDPENNMTGRVTHTYFLLSAKAMQQLHKADDYVKALSDPPSDTRYDEAFWRRSASAFVLVNGEMYYADHVDNALKRFSDKAKLMTFSDDWNRWKDDLKWTVVKSFVRLATDGAYLFYTSKNAVYRYDIGAAQSEKLFDLTDRSDKKTVFGMMYENGTFICDVTDSPNNFAAMSINSFRVKKAYAPHVHTWDKGTVVTPAAVGKEGQMRYVCTVCGAVALESIPALKGETEAPAAYFPGDADGDGKLAAEDARLTLRASVRLEIIEKGTDAFRAADADHDGEIEAEDARLILRASVKLEVLS